MDQKKKAGTSTIVEATRKDFSSPNRSAIASGIAAWIGRVALWGLLPLNVAEAIIRWVRSA
ncbi:MAG: hypothetical protein O9345_16565 [Burkholderiaceae bacterium]|jgi:hypothetical protein|nr:hypothetical protein [Burkholderiales bacterium]MCZ8107627.1 hypothetical protein [Burkholderiales bacterium]MCZ8339739.1 hypothetical protein [Burkholderiaceae bacterium]